MKMLSKHLDFKIWAIKAIEAIVVFISLLSFINLASCSTFPEKESNMSFTVSLPGGSVQLSGNPINVVATSTTSIKTNHFMLFHIISTDGAVLHGPWTESVPVKTTQGGGCSATLDIHSIVDSEFFYAFSKVFNNTAPKVLRRDRLAANFTIKIGERYIENGNRFETNFSDPEAVIATTTLVVLKGGLPMTEYNILNDSGKSFYTEYIQKPQFLSRSPRNITLERNSWLKLWFIKEYTGTISIKLYIYYYNSVTPHILTHTDVFLSGNMYELNTNLDVWGTLLGTPKYYIIEMPLGNGNFDRFQININYDYKEHVNDFYFTNSFGGIDLLHCTGKLITLPETNGETFTRSLPELTNSMSRTKICDRKTINRRYKCNTGSLSLEQRLHFLEFASTPHTWWKTELFGTLADSATFVPIIVRPGSFTLDDQSDEPQSIEFEFEIAQSEKF